MRMSRFSYPTLMLAACSLGACGGQAESPESGPALGAMQAALKTAPPPAEHGCSDHEHEDDPDARRRASHRVSWRRGGHPGPSGVVNARLLGINDFHGRLSEGLLVAGRPVGGAAVLAAHLRAASAGFEGRSLIVHAGDHVGASP